MKQSLIVGVFVICTLLLVNNIAFAQDPEPIKVADLFTWARTTPPDWARGALLAGMGLIGAMVTIFGFIGGAVPGTAGQAKIDSDTDRLDRWNQRLDELIVNSPTEPAAIAEVEKAVNNLRDDLRAERWRQFAIATTLYAVLGAVFSALLAQDLLQALVIGAGWTGVLGTLGLKKDYAERKATKNATLEKTIERAKKLEEGLKGTGTGYEDLGLKESLDDLEREARIAQRL